MRLCFSEKMPNTLDDSEDFIADTPPAQLKTHQWRDVKAEIDLKKVFEYFLMLLAVFCINISILHCAKSSLNYNLLYDIGIYNISGVCK